VEGKHLTSTGKRNENKGKKMEEGRGGGLLVLLSSAILSAVLFFSIASGCFSKKSACGWLF
jgi:hypothetical protein